MKLRPGGPKALRTPEHMDGVPGLSEEEQSRVDRSKAIHDRGRQILRAAFSTAAQGGLAQPPSSMAWLEEDNMTSYESGQRIARMCQPASLD